jgi:ABC-type uncharacterized transport system ATPase subunit
MSVPRSGALAIECLHMSKRFGTFTALDDVTLRVRAGAFHALLGENGAGKSTLVKCLVGYQRADEGQVMVDERERDIHTPHDAHALGIGMVYQHFTLVPSMSVAENLVMSRDDVPTVVNWRRERAALREFMGTVPFVLPLDAPVSSLAAGEKQKCEILKQLYLRRRFVVLDEPTSVLTPQEADEVLGLLRDMARRGQISVLLITHKLREVMAFADRVTVLRRGRLAGEGEVSGLDPAALAEMMVGSREVAQTRRHHRAAQDQAPVRLAVRGLRVADDTGLEAVGGVDFEVRAGEIVGVAGVSGNGQRELVEALIGQRGAAAGGILVNGEPYAATRGQMARHRVFSLPEEPLRNACVGALGVADNLALRNFDRPPLALGPWLRRGALRAQARRLIAEFKVKTAGPDAPIATLSGGNVQRAVLARELSGEVSVLIVANPVFGLDLAAVAEIHARIMAARNAGAAVLLVSEDLDELLELCDRLLVMFEGRMVHHTTPAEADIGVIGSYMAGHGHAVAA